VCSDSVAGIGDADPTLKLTAECNCRLAAGGTVPCGAGKYCWATGCMDTPLPECKLDDNKKLEADCTCGMSGFKQTCVKGKYCSSTTQSCVDKAAHSDECTANSEICLDSQFPCSMDVTSTKKGITLDYCIKDSKMFDDQYIKYTCVKDGELAVQKYKDKDCTTTDGKKDTYTWGECSVMTKVTWTGKCGGKEGGVGSVATLLAFVLTALITLS
jgi:hypothetical protein